MDLESAIMKNAAPQDELEIFSNCLTHEEIIFYPQPAQSLVSASPPSVVGIHTSTKKSHLFAERSPTKTIVLFLQLLRSRVALAFKINVPFI